MTIPVARPSIAATIIAVLTANPAGLTSSQVAAKTGMAPYTVSGKLSKLAAYGIIDKIAAKPTLKAIWKTKVF